MAEDHDLLIQVNTKLERVIVDLKELSNTVSKRVDALESEKLDMEEFSRYVKESSNKNTDHEKRIRSLEVWKWSIVGALLLLQILVPLALRYLKFN